MCLYGIFEVIKMLLLYLVLLPSEKRLPFLRREPWVFFKSYCPVFPDLVLTLLYAYWSARWRKRRWRPRGGTRGFSTDPRRRVTHINFLLGTG